MREIDPSAFVGKLASGDLKAAKIIDVREPEEWAYYYLEEAELIPMNSIPERLGELPADRDLYVVCAHGVRSAMVCDYLRRNGFERVVNVAGEMAAVSWHKDGFRYD